MYAVCADHVAMAIDEFIENTRPPRLYELEQISLSDWEAPPAHCAYCERKPKYLVV